MIEPVEIKAVVQHTEKKYDGGWLLECHSPAFGAESRGSEPRLGGFAVARVGVYCFLSRREGDSEELVTAGGQNPQMKTKSGRAFEDRRRGGDDLPADENPGTRICIGAAGRVSLKSCSGAILNVGLGGVGCVCCLRTQ